MQNVEIQAQDEVAKLPEVRKIPSMYLAPISLLIRLYVRNQGVTAERNKTAEAQAESFRQAALMEEKVVLFSSVN